MPKIVYPAYRVPMLYEALKKEGYTLPDECADVSLELPVDGLTQLVMRVNVTDELLAKIGRALAEIGTASIARRVSYEGQHREDS